MSDLLNGKMFKIDPTNKLLKQYETIIKLSL